MSVVLQVDGNQDDTAHVSILEGVELYPTSRDGYVIATMDGQRRRAWVSQVYAKSDQGWEQWRLRVQTHNNAEKEAFDLLEVHKPKSHVCFGLVS